MIPGDTIKALILAQSAAGLPVSGLVIGDLTVSGTLNGAAASISAALTEVDTIGAWRRYRLDFVVPALSGVSVLTVTAQPNSAGVYLDTLRVVDGEIEAVDLTSIYGVISAPVVSVVNAGGPAGDIPLRLVKSTYVPLSFSATDQTGAVIDLSGYDTPVFGIKSRDQTTTTYSQTTGITMTAGGLVTIAVPESATFYTALATGSDEASLYWSFVANEAATATMKRCLARGTLSVIRSEV